MRSVCLTNGERANREDKREEREEKKIMKMWVFDCQNIKGKKLEIWSDDEESKFSSSRKVSCWPTKKKKGKSLSWGFQMVWEGKNFKINKEK